MEPFGCLGADVWSSLICGRPSFRRQSRSRAPPSASSSRSRARRPHSPAGSGLTCRPGPVETSRRTGYVFGTSVPAAGSCAYTVPAGAVALASVQRDRAQAELLELGLGLRRHRCRPGPGRSPCGTAGSDGGSGSSDGGSVADADGERLRGRRRRRRGRRARQRAERDQDAGVGALVDASRRPPAPGAITRPAATSGLYARAVVTTRPAASSSSVAFGLPLSDHVRHGDGRRALAERHRDEHLGERRDELARRRLLLGHVAGGHVGDVGLDRHGDQRGVGERRRRLVRRSCRSRRARSRTPRAGPWRRAGRRASRPRPAAPPRELRDDLADRGREVVLRRARRREAGVPQRPPPPPPRSIPTTSGTFGGGGPGRQREVDRRALVDLLAGGGVLADDGAGLGARGRRLRRRPRRSARRPRAPESASACVLPVTSGTVTPLPRVTTIAASHADGDGERRRRRRSRMLRRDIRLIVYRPLRLDVLRSAAQAAAPGTACGRRGAGSPGRWR